MAASSDRLVPIALHPRAGETGLLTADLADIGVRTTSAWQIFTAGLAEVDLSAESRDRGRTVRENLIPLGAWPDSRGIADMILEAGNGATTTEPLTATRRRLRESHRNADDQEVRAAIGRAADEVAMWFASGPSQEDATAITPSALGPVPVATFVHAAAFQLAAAWRDIPGAPANPQLEALGLAALVDSAGAVAGRMRATASITAVTPELTVGTGTRDGAWRTVELADSSDGPAVIGPAGVLIDAAGGRIDVFGIARDLRVRDARKLGAMAVVLDAIPDLPAAAVLRRTARIASLLSR